MKTACFIPVKANSERVKGKNFKVLCGTPLYQRIINHAIEANCFDDIFVDTDSEEVKQFCKTVGVAVIDRKAELAKNTANGNDLLNYWFELYPNYDYYFQLFATAPFLQPTTINKCFNTLTNGTVNDSILTVLRNNGFYWLNGTPINYRPCVLPRSQDLVPVYEETTGLYGIKNEALKKYHCRIGATPYMFEVDKFEAIDINTETDFKIAEFIGQLYWNL